ncbi:phage regulatory CII family protein, partial [Klebsiella quasipneumoniae]|uniref:phage regulatory CII family protein n=2 Tax=Klebsiella/Raoultella group TaxID=2890311 RepID=UPI001966F21B
MFDYQTSKHARFDAACRAFALAHNLEEVASAVGMRPQMLRNKLNPVQPHRLTCD